MGNRVSFHLDGDDDDTGVRILDDYPVPVPGSMVTLDGQLYDVLSAISSHWPGHPGMMMTDVRIKPVPEAAEGS